LPSPLPYQFEYENENNMETITRSNHHDLQGTDPVGEDFLFANDDAEVENDEDQRKWREVVRRSIDVLQFIGNGEDKLIVKALTVPDIFTRDKARYIVKATQRRYFEIFPWCLVYKDHKGHRFRESLSFEKAKLIVEALIFFWTDSFDEHDRRVITRFCSTPPASCLSPIHDLQVEIIKNRENIKFRQDISETVSRHESRLTRLERVFSRGFHEDQPSKKRRHQSHGENFLSLEITLGDHDLRLDALERETLESSFVLKLPTDNDLAPATCPSSDLDDQTESSYSHELSDDDLDCLQKDLQNIIGDPTSSPQSPASSPHPPLLHNGEREIVNNICSKSTLIVELLNQIISSPAGDEKQYPPLDLESINTNLDLILLSLQTYHNKFYH
jgi:hypothetical protein